MTRYPNPTRFALGVVGVALIVFLIGVAVGIVVAPKPNPFVPFLCPAPQVMS